TPFGQAVLVAPVGVHQVDLPAAVPRAREGDPGAVGGPHRLRILPRGALRQPDRDAPVGIGDIDRRLPILGARERDPLSLRRQRRPRRRPAANRWRWPNRRVPAPPVPASTATRPLRAVATAGVPRAGATPLRPAPLVPASTAPRPAPAVATVGAPWVVARAGAPWGVATAGSPRAGGRDGAPGPRPAAVPRRMLR